MTGLRPDRISERLIPKHHEDRVEIKYLIGEYEYDPQSEPECPDQNHFLYPKYWHTDYGSFKQEDRFLELYKWLRVQTFSGAIDSKDVDDFLDEVGFEDFYKRDEAFIDHLKKAHDVPNKPVPREDSREAARFWLKYILERGPKES